MKRVAILGSAAFMLAGLSAPAQAQFNTALDVSEQTARDTATSQQRIDQLDDQTAALLNDYRANLKQLESVRRYNASLTRNIESQNREIARLRQHFASEKEFADLMSKNGISNDTTVVFYGDKTNWWACYALWVFKLFGHKDCRVMDGGRKKWVDEGRELTKEVPSFETTEYTPNARTDYKIRAFRDQVLDHVNADQPLVDVRSPQEFNGELLHMPGSPQEGALRGGHIRGAKNVSWSRAVAEDGTFKTADELRAIYEEEQGLKSSDSVVAYCRIGERSSHTWFVLTYLLGYPSVRNYDGSWTEWGNLVGVPIENPSKQK